MQHMSLRPALQVKIGLIFFLFLGIECQAQDSAVIQYRSIGKSENYINENEICNILQDPRGFIWVGSYLGIYKYDGQRVRNFAAKQIDSSITIAGKINLLLVKGDSILLNVELKGLYWWNTLQHKASKILFTSNETNLKNVKYTCAWIENDHSIWLGTIFKGLVHLNPIEGTAKNFLFTKDSVYSKKWISSSTMVSILPIARSTLLLGTNDSLIEFNYSTGKYNKLSIPAVRNDGIRQHTIGKIVSINDSLCLLTTWANGIIVYNTRTHSMTSYYWNTKERSGATNISFNALHDIGSHYWIATPDAGLLNVDLQTKKFTYMQYKNEEGVRTRLVTDNLMKDRQGQLWAQTIHEFGRIYEKRLALPCEPKVKFSALCPAGPYHVMATAMNSAAIYLLNHKGEIKQIFNPKGARAFFWQIKPVPGGKQFILRHDDGFYVFSPEQNRIDRLDKFNKQIGLEDAHNYDIDDELRLWAPQFYYRLSSYDLGKKQYKKYSTQDLHHKLPNLEYIINLMADTIHHGVWFSNFNDYGLLYFNPSNDSVVNFSDYFPVLKNNPHQVVVLPDSSLMITLNHFGVVRIYNPFKSTRKLIQFSIENGQLMSNHYHYIFLIGDEVWMFTKDGFSVYDSKKNSFRHFPDAELNANLIARGAVITKNHKLFYRDINDNLQWLDLNTMIAKKLPPRAYVYQLKVNSRVIEAYIPDSTLVQMNYNDPLQLEFSVIYTANAEHIYYEWKMDNYQSSWISLPDNSLSLGGLPAGSYNLQVRTSFNGVEWNDKVLTLCLKVSPPFWKSIWFVLLTGIGLTAIAYILIVGRIKQIRKENAIRLELVQSKLKALQAQMNPHFIFNCFNTIDSFILQNRKMEATKLVHAFSKLTRRVLEHTAQHEILLAEEIETLEAYLQTENLRTPGKFAWKIEVDAELLSFKIPPLLLQPFVENAVMHGIRPLKDRQGVIQICARKVNDQIEIMIIDNGVGRNYLQEDPSDSKRKSHRSMSMEITYERIAAMHQPRKLVDFIQVVDGTKAMPGTTVIILLPLPL